MDNKLGNVGLKSNEVEKNREKYGSNRLSEKKQEGFWKKYFSAFDDPIIKILMVALVINLIFVFTGNAEWYEAVGIFIAVLIATFVSTLCEYSNEKAFAKLQADADKIKSKVYRDGVLTEIPIDDLVYGDFIVLQAGDKIPVDGVMEQGEIKVNQATLNGEAEDVTKITPKSELEFGKEKDLLAKDRVYRGTIVTEGECIIQAVKVGDNTILGELAQEIQEDNERETPLKVKLNKLANQISKFGYIGAILIAFAYMFMQIHSAGLSNYFTTWQQPLADIVDAVILAVIIIVMAVPEGLPLMIALVSGLNMKKMLKDNVLVRKINGIETAGSLNILFSDKTGTITKGQLEVVEFIDGNLNEDNDFCGMNESLRNCVYDSIMFNSSASVSRKNNKLNIVGGNGTERALIQFVGNENYDRDIKTIDQIPFNSTNKYSATTIKYNTQLEGEGYLTLIKGAPEKIISKCTNYIDNGQVKPFNKFGEMEMLIQSKAKESKRMLALATSNETIKDGNIELKDLTLVGIVAIRDEVRPEAIEAIKQVQSAGVQVVMITGDIKDTAVAIAKDAGIIQSKDDIVLTSSELQELSDNELKTKLPNIRVIARALPNDKSRLVKIAQELNLVAGMTGDGVNDSPALKKADVGFAMGSGTEVAKEAGDIVILDDNFKSIEKAILFGRTIYNNIRMFIMFQLTINVSAVLISFLAPLLNIPTPLTIVQILFVNLIMDTLCALMLGGEAPKKSYMKEKPKLRTENIISKYMMSSILLNAGYILIVSLLLLKVGIFNNIIRNNEIAIYTTYFVFFVFSSLLNGFNVRTESLNLLSGVRKNKPFILIFLLVTVITIIMTFIGGDLLRTTQLIKEEWLLTIVLSVGIIIVDLLKKGIRSIWKSSKIV